LRLLPLHRARGPCYVPADILAAAGTNRDEFVAGSDRAGAERAVAAMVALGRDHAARFETEARGMPPALRPAFLPAALAPAYLDRFARLGFAVCEQPADIPALRRHWTLLRRAMRGWG
jgi:phytoene synthase